MLKSPVIFCYPTIYAIDNQSPIGYDEKNGKQGVTELKYLFEFS